MVSRGLRGARSALAPTNARPRSRRGFWDRRIGGAGSLHHDLHGILIGHSVTADMVAALSGNTFHGGPPSPLLRQQQSHCRTQRQLVLGGLGLLPPLLGSTKEVVQPPPPSRSPPLAVAVVAPAPAPAGCVHPTPSPACGARRAPPPPPLPHPGHTRLPAGLAKLPPQLQNLPLPHHCLLLLLELGPVMLQPIHDLGSVGDGGDNRESGARAQGLSGPPPALSLGALRTADARVRVVVRVVRDHLHRPQLFGVHPGLHLRMGANQELQMVHMRLHAIPQPRNPGDRGGTPYRTNCPSSTPYLLRTAHCNLQCPPPPAGTGRLTARGATPPP